VGRYVIAEEPLMVSPRDPVAERPLGGPRRNGHCPVAGPVAACCAPLLAGAVALVLVDKAKVTFLVLFSSSTAVMVVLMAESGHGLVVMAVRHGAAGWRMLRSALTLPELRRVVAGMRQAIASVDGFVLNRRHT
jgi:hypothetical protein